MKILKFTRALRASGNVSTQLRASYPIKGNFSGKCSPVGGSLMEKVERNRTLAGE